ncbi:MAG: hypothetical protein VR68_08655 [Peptococcaceae bacterium BRH_c4a]|nr:MAG: hypothetical protein VR68_08655 [Peptococcaceae bacterium BRH_c4a]
MFPTAVFEENIVFNPRGEAYAFYRLSGTTYEYLAPHAKRSVLRPFEELLYVYTGDGQLLYLTEELTITEKQYVGPISLSNEPDIIKEASRHTYSACQALVEGRAQARRVYLGLKLPTVNKFDFSFSAKEVRDHFLDIVSAIKKNTNISERTISEAVRAERELYHQMSGTLDISRITFSDLDFIVRRNVQRAGALPPLLSPRKKGVFDRALLYAMSEGAIIDPKLNYVKITLGDRELYQTFLTFADVPRYIRDYDDEWLAALNGHLFPVDAVIHFKVEAPVKARGKVISRKKIAKDQINESYKGEGEASEDSEWAVGESRSLESKLSGGMPLITFHTTFSVAAYDKTEMEANAKALMQFYRQREYRVVRPPGDQVKCFFSFFPAGNPGSVGIETDPGFLSAGGPTVGYEVGDNRGFFIGWTKGKIPVFFLPGLAMSREENTTGTIVCTGVLGGGKSNLKKLIMELSGLMGARIFSIDPKDEDHVFKKLPFEMKQIDLSALGEAKINPFKLSVETIRARAIANDYLDLILDTQRDDRETRRLVVATAVNQVMLRSPENQDMHTVLDTLEHITKHGLTGLELPYPVNEASNSRIQEEAQNCLMHLHTMSMSSLGRMVFGKGTPDLGGTEQITVVNLKELPLPQPDKRKEQKITESERQGVGLMYLAAAAAREAMLRAPRDQLKVLPIDEGWVLLDIPEGRRLIKEIIRMSRSFNIIPILCVQNASDIDIDGIRNNVGYVFCFRANYDEEIKDNCKMLGIQYNEYIQKMFTSLESGQCFMRDIKHRVGKVYISPQPDYLLQLFDTSGGNKR